MGEVTGIGWTDHTFNPWIGCTKVSPACDNCYAADMAARYGWAKWGDYPRQRTAASTWKQPLAWNRKAKAAGEQRFVFCASLADVFDNQAPPEWRADLFALIRATPNLTWLLLTKRIGIASRLAEEAGGLPTNVMLGGTMCNDDEYQRDAMKLHDAGKRWGVPTFGSFEPLLGAVYLDTYAPDWIIVGGESGPNARPLWKDWVRRMRDDAADLRRAFFFKQWGGRTPKANGKMLDGREHCERPHA